MVCTSPIKAYRAALPNEDGERPIFFVRGRNDVVDLVLACGQCQGCRLERSRQWAVRCMHESKMHVDNCFITLTYSDNFLPANRSLVLKDVQDFLKRLRKRYGSGIKYYYCGEYGPKLGRPHYHLCMFGMDFDDKVKWKINHNDDVLYTSKKLSSLWTKGFSTVGAMTFQSAAYVARYAMKKVTGAAAEFHYQWIDEEGNLREKVPEFGQPSRRPGIGKAFFDKFVADIYPSDEVIVNAARARPPRAYDEYFAALDALTMEEIKFQREERGSKHADNNTPDRLKVRAEVLRRKLERLKRGVPNA